MAALCTLLLGCLVMVLLTGSSAADIGVNKDTLDPSLHSKKAVASTNGTDLSAGGGKVPNSDAKSNKVNIVGDTNNGKVRPENRGGDLASGGKSKGKGGVEKKDEKKLRSGAGSTEDPKGHDREGDMGLVTLPRKEGPLTEECDPSSRCTAEKGKLVACLRFPGNDSPKLSLLIQNKGKGPLTVTISPPDLLELKENKVQMKEKENHEVMVSIGKLGSRSSIYLTAGNDNCTLDFKDMILHSTRKDFHGLMSSQPTNFLRQKPMTAFIFFAALIVLATVAVFIGVRKKHFLSGESKYQRLDMMELPVSNVVKPESSDFSEGWDESWGDGWDDEEVPKTPSMPVTPSVSSKGLAPRRATKEGWKD
ncbi:uncharacterized protein LOC116205279 isoform X1 [Punica granatum]|uniref:Uncharacterized protein LOC116205279 isoform X1 n=1 Tax=Punica granatum TaxID=22663 RepID=A0A6P8DP74_PUNGR|nr:uncharacterized protein LOC116205279 isoform X1 [Punica granatum]